MTKKSTNNERRRFLTRAGIFTAGFAVSSILPFNLFSKGKFSGNSNSNKIKVNIHPSAVKRTK